MSASDSIVEPGALLADRYRLLEEIGRGGFGMVYRARQLNMERDVAIKILPPKFNAVSDVVERFKREAKLASRLRHPNTITVHDYGRHEDLLFIVMEVLDGEDLADILAHTPTLPLARILHIGRQVLKSLDEAHSHNIIHRDLKPENIFLTRLGGEEDFVKVLDFGIAKLTMPDGSASEQGRKLTVTGSTVGTPTYMSPEQAAGEEVDPLTDLYALAVILYEMACGLPPFYADNPVKIMRSHLFDPVPSFRKEPLRGSQFEAVLLKALAKEKADRFGSAQQFLNALGADASAMLQPAGYADDPPTAEFFGLDQSSSEITDSDEEGLGELELNAPLQPVGVPDFRARSSEQSGPRAKRTTESLLAALEQDWPRPSSDSNPAQGELGDEAQIPFDAVPSDQERVHEGATSASASNQISGLSETSRSGPLSYRDSSGFHPNLNGPAPRGFSQGSTVSSIITIKAPDPDEIILLTQKKEPTPAPIVAPKKAREREDSPLSTARPNTPTPAGADDAPADSTPGEDEARWAWQERSAAAKTPETSEDPTIDEPARPKSPPALLLLLFLGAGLAAAALIWLLL